MGDKRFNALETGGQRKQAYAEWVNGAKKRNEEAQRMKKKLARDDWVKLIKDWPELKPSTRYRDVAENFFREETFKLLEEDERDELSRTLWMIKKRKSAMRKKKTGKKKKKKKKKKK